MYCDEPIRVLQINSGSREFGGVSSFLYNVYNHIDREKVQFDFLSPNITTYGIYRNEIERMGGRIYELGITGNAIVKKIRLFFGLRRFLDRHSYPVIHINSGNFFFNLIAATAVQRAGSEVIIHSHNTEDPDSSAVKKKLISMLKPLFKGLSSKTVACSSAAAFFMFDDTTAATNTVIIRNGIDTNRFSYNPRIRDTIRNELELSGKFVIGHVGRFDHQKNHDFLIDVFEKVCELVPEAALLLIGSGKEEGRIREKVSGLGLSDKVFFAGSRTDVENYYQAMDVFVLPSKYEGFGIVNIEAQCSGLPCVISDAVPDDVIVTDMVTKRSLDDPASEWAGSVVSCRLYDRKNFSDKVASRGYDISAVAGQLEKMYYECRNTHLS